MQKSLSYSTQLKRSAIYYSDCIARKPVQIMVSKEPLSRLLAHVRCTFPECLHLLSTLIEYVKHSELLK